MGNCSTTLQFGESCLFTCDNGMKLSQPTICQDGALALGRCVAIAYDCQYFESTSSAGYVVPYYDRDANGLLDMLYMPADGKINVLSQTTPRVFESDELVSNAPSGASLCVYGTGEYNGDGVMDFFLVGAASPGTSWGSSRGTADVLYTSKTDGSFEAKSYINNYWGNRCTSADFNNDLLQDAAVSNVWFSDPVRVYVSSNATGTGVLGNPYSLSGSPRFGHDISHGDFDGDGILDLVVVSSDNHGDYVYFGTGDGTFTSPLFVSQGSRGAVAVCDVNGDGHMDIIIGDYYSTRSLQVYVNNGSGSRTSLFSSVQIQGLSVVYGLACADIDHDGDADLVIGGRFVLWNSGQSPYFSTSEALSLPPKSRNGNYIEYATRLVDVDGDGLLDIVSNKWMCFAGTAGQCLEVNAPAHGSLGDCVAPLMDGASCRPACDDGYEIVASANCSSGQFTPAVCRRAPVPSPSPLPSNGCSVTAPTKGTLGNCSSVLSHGSSCQFTCDDGLRLSSATTCRNGVLQRGRCTPTLTNVSFTCESVTGSGINPPYVVPFNKANKLGLLNVLYSPAAGSIEIREQISPRVFNVTRTISTASNGALLCMKGVNDYNQDGEDDFFVVGRGVGPWKSGSGTPDELYTSAGDGQFVTQNWPNSYWGYRCDSADFNGDGYPDVIAQNIWPSDPALIYMNSANSSESILGNPVAISGSPSFATDVTHGDFDGDGNIDLVLVSSGQGGDYVFFGTGNGSFVNRLKVSAGLRGAVTACDINGDGNLDLIIGDFRHSIQIYINNGSGSRTWLFSSLHISGFRHVYGFACDDIDGDGKPDLVVMQSHGDPDVVLLNSGVNPYFSSSAAITLPLQFDNSGDQLSVALKDLDGDGLLDIVGKNGICWLGELGQCVEIYPPEHGNLGDCVIPMLNGTSCTFACDDGYVVDGVTTCSSGQATPATCRVAPAA